MIITRIAIVTLMLMAGDHLVVHVTGGPTSSSMSGHIDLESAASYLSQHANYEFREVARYGKVSQTPAWSATGTSLARDVYEDTQVEGSVSLSLIDEHGKYWIKGSHGRFARLAGVDVPENLGSPEGFLSWLSGAHVDTTRGMNIKFHAVSSTATNLVDFSYRTNVTGIAVIRQGRLNEVSVSERLPHHRTFLFLVQFSKIGRAPLFRHP